MDLNFDLNSVELRLIRKFGSEQRKRLPFLKHGLVIFCEKLPALFFLRHELYLVSVAILLASSCLSS